MKSNQQQISMPHLVIRTQPRRPNSGSLYYLGVFAFAQYFSIYSSELTLKSMHMEAASLALAVLTSIKEVYLICRFVSVFVFFPRG